VRERRAVGGRLVPVALAVLVAAGGVSTWAARQATRILPAGRALEELAYYPSGRWLTAASLGEQATLADLTWLRGIQYYGEHRQTDNRFTRMEHVFDILTTLAPEFVPAYVFGGFALAQEGRNFPAAERLMLKGIEANPRSGTLAFELGFLYYVRPGGRDFNKAAEFFQLASYQPAAPPQARRFAAFARQNGGNLLLSLELWREIYRSTRNSYLRDTALHEMRKITQAIATGRDDLARHKMGTPQVLIHP
jgi:hypothetical protein